MPQALIVHPFYDTDTGTFSYVLANPGSGRCAVVDPVLDYDPVSDAVSTGGADAIVELVRANGYTVEWILDTHVHADHLTAAAYLKRQFLCAQVAIGERVRTVQEHFAPRFGQTGGAGFDRVLGDGERLDLGHTCIRVLATPGHTPACVTYLCEGFACVGDTVFAPDLGTARCDFPGGDARVLYESVQRLYALVPSTRLLLCHDYPPADRHRRFCVTVAEQREHNAMLSATTDREDFVTRRIARDATLAAPRLLEPSLRANLFGGVLPEWRMAGGAA